MNDLPNFDILVKMASDDPDALKRLQDKLVNEVIMSAPEVNRPKLRGLQFKIDAERLTHNNHVGACVAIYKMMTDNVHTLNAAFKGELQLKNPTPNNTGGGTVVNLFNKNN